MFWEIFVKLCADNGEKPTPLITKLGFSKGNVSHWKNGHTPQAVALRKIADYFSVSIEYLLGEEISSKKELCSTSEADLKLLEAFHSSPQVLQDAIRKMLDL